jgi:putative peptide maturation dehydrogenase
VRRSAYASFRYADGDAIDLGALLRGELRRIRAPEIVAGSCLTGEERPLLEQELAAISAAPAEGWIDPEATGAPPPLLQKLARDGLLVTDSDEPTLAALRRREDQLAEAHWPPRAAAYHFLTRRRDAALGIAAEALAGGPVPEAAAAALVEAEGEPPSPFPQNRGGTRRQLPLVDKPGAVFTTLMRRRTARSFDRRRRLPLDDLATVLRYVFGAQGYERVGALVALAKTSPSGGATHAIEAYPLVVNVEGLEPGLHHYDVASHSLELLEGFDHADARELVDQFTCGQFWFGDAHVLFVLAARFERMFWKYRGDDRAYGVLLMDAGHLSQTLYLVCTELGLGAFITAYVNDRNIEERLGLDGVTEGVLAVCGCGIPSTERSPLEPELLPYVPRKTTL